MVKATNISRGGMFHHFKGKEDIFNQVADRFVFNFFREGESFIESPESTTPLKDFLAHCTRIVGKRMLHFSETLGASATAASFMGFVLYLKVHYSSWQEKMQEHDPESGRFSYGTVLFTFYGKALS
ncbi:TetR/AcrR family transcriptional regulator [Porphyromonas crevioricanis]|uniref:TetR/AcrR family transcriptional regulator n=1 Tax=Porphyromonas crevioricanis TaxID=393921 RepID=UPI001F2CDA35|nr:TetR/AcrR family transcriptional regulator [Porphyromonas crevioricanis]